MRAVLMDTQLEECWIILLKRNNEFIPCISYSNMAKIVRFRYEDKCQSIMTDAIYNEIDNITGCIELIELMELWSGENTE